MPVERPSISSAPANVESDFQQLLSETRAEVERRLTRFLAAKVDEATNHGRDVAAMADAVRALTMRGGKRFRAAMLFASFQACTDAPALHSAVWEGGVALELLQSYLLVHDDWMDGDEIRRGGPSVHVALREHFGSARKGEAAAILAGDYANALAQEVLGNAPLPPVRAQQAFVCFAQIQQDAVYGQQLDLSGASHDVERMHALKTGSYTVRGPLRLGAIFAGATDVQRRALDAYADPLGIAFQLRDDVLGAFGSPDVIGKPAGNDVREGKRTALLAEADPRLDAAGRRAVERALGRENASADDIGAALHALEKCGARAAVETRLDELVHDAQRALAKAPLRAVGVRFLQGAATVLTARRT